MVQVVSSNIIINYLNALTFYLLMIFNLMNYRWLIYMFILISPKLCQDYWSEDFDENKNCKDEELIGKLKKENNPPRCANNWIGSTWFIPTMYVKITGGICWPPSLISPPSPSLQRGFPSIYLLSAIPKIWIKINLKF